jgi:hypothetical protein
MMDAIFFDTYEVAQMVREHLERKGFKRASHEQWTIMLTVQGAVVTGAAKPEADDS